MPFDNNLEVRARLEKYYIKLSDVGIGSNVSIDADLIEYIVTRPSWHTALNIDLDVVDKPDQECKKIIWMLAEFDETDIDKIISAYTEGNYWKSKKIDARINFIKQTLGKLQTIQDIKTATPKEKNSQELQKAARKIFGGTGVEAVIEGLQEQVPIYFDTGKNFWMWNNNLHVYERTDETEIMCQITEHMDLTIYTKDFKNQIIEGLRQTGRLKRVKNTKKEWIQFQNGVFNLKNGEIFEATPDYLFISQIPHKIGSSEETPLLDKLFRDWQGDNAALLEEISAYCMYDDYPIQRIFALIGPGGNGKGQYMKFLKRLLGFENVVGTELDRLSESRFEAAKLFKKKAAFVGETNYTLSKLSLIHI